MNEFKVGDIICGIKNSHYGVTNFGMKKGIVVAVYDEREFDFEDLDDFDDIKVKVLEHSSRTNVGAQYDVKSKFFNLIEPKNKLVVNFLNS